MKWEEGKELFKEIPKKSSLGKGKKKVKMKRKAKGYKTSLNSEEAIFWKTILIVLMEKTRIYSH